MKVLVWIGIAFLVIFIVCAVVFAAFSFYVSNPGTYNAIAYDSKVSNQYYMRDNKVIYVMDGNFFQIGGAEIEGADPDTFEVVDQSYAKDINNVYYDGKPVAGANPSSVEFVESEFEKNSANSGYLISNGKVFCYGEVIDEADPASFSYLIGSYAMDKNYIYYYIDIKIPRKVTPAVISDANDRYIRHGEQVLYNGEVISDEAGSFKPINDEYAKDDFRVYSHGKVVDGMVPEGFTVISPYYRKDKHQAYYFNLPIPGSDPKTFKVLNDAVSKDRKHIYYNGSIVENKKPSEISRSDADELQKLWMWRSLHLDEKLVILVPSDDVEDITNDYYTYNNDVYSRTEKLAGVKPEDVVVLDQSEKAFTRIGKQVFYYGTAIPGADPETFTVVADRFSKDANHVFWAEHRVLDAHPSTFEYKTNLYAVEDDEGGYNLKIGEY
ncbi:DKNYY domain-containing protein [Marinobacter sp. KMM 10035]|uniref:DKNYY domain-containing protein n=1 Tax=Marinobacter sp. KMM 10035 TaxID=3134034 RepID=UPI00397B5B13